MSPIRQLLAGNAGHTTSVYFAGIGFAAPRLVYAIVFILSAHAKRRLT